MNGVLIGHGPISWDEVAAVLDGLDCAWADLTGFKTGPVPAAAPPYSHVWGWSSDRWVLVRVDGDHGIVAELHADVTPRLPRSEMVTVTCQEATQWPGDAERLSRTVRQNMPPGPIHLLQAGFVAPVVFVHLGELDPACLVASPGGAPQRAR